MINPDKKNLQYI